jgi:RNA polymerase sigma-70 factor, ECF subfamily
VQRALLEQGFVSNSAGASLSPELLSALFEAFERAAEAWPDVRLPEARFGEEIAKRVQVQGGDDPVGAIRAMHVEDLYLVIACAMGDKAALTHFEKAHVPRVRAVLARMRLSAEETEEALQALREELFVSGPTREPRILNYAGRAKLHGWLRIVAGRVSQRVIRRPAGQVVLQESGIPAHRDDPELEYLKKACGDAFQEAFREALATLTPKDRLLLKHRFTYDLSCEEIGAIYGVNRTTAFRWVTDARARLVEATRASIVSRLRLGRGDFSSVVRLVQSQIDITLSSLANPGSL